MMRKGVLLFVTALSVLVLFHTTLGAQSVVKPTVIAELKLSYPSNLWTDHTSFTLRSQEKITVSLNLPILSGSHKGWVGVINSISKEEIWGLMVDAREGPIKIVEVKTLTPGTYKMIVEYSGEGENSPPAKWSGTLTVSH